jgi:N-acetyltransferase
LARDLRTNEDVCPAKPGPTFADRALLEPEYRCRFENGDCNVKLEYIPLTGTFLHLQPFAPDLKEEVRSAVDCDPDTWAIMPINPIGDGFDVYWSAACGAPLGERMAYAIRRQSDDRVIGMSTYYTGLLSQGGVEIGTSFLHPDARGGAANPEAKLLMLDHAFDCGAVRVQFRVDTRNRRSQAAVAKLGAVREGVLRRDRLTWTGYIRDTVVFSILDREWPELKARLQQRVASLIANLTKA